jgi:hypothetical protein
MTFTSLSDDSADQSRRLSDAAYRTHHEGLVWSNRILADCQLTEADLSRCHGTAESVAELVAYWHSNLARPCPRG